MLLFPIYAAVRQMVVDIFNRIPSLHPKLNTTYNVKMTKLPIGWMIIWNVIWGILGKGEGKGEFWHTL